MDSPLVIAILAHLKKDNAREFVINDRVCELCGDVISLAELEAIKGAINDIACDVSWLKYHGMHLPLDVWRKLTSPWITSHYYPYTADDLRDDAAPNGISALSWNKNLTESAVRYLVDGSFRTFQIEVMLRYREIINPTSCELRTAFDNEIRYDEVSAVGHEIAIRDYHKCEYRGDGVCPVRHHDALQCCSRNIPIAFFIQHNEVPWGIYSFVTRDDYTLAQYRDFIDSQRKFIDQRAGSPDDYNPSDVDSALVRGMIGQYCRDTIDALCPYKVRGWESYNTDNVLQYAVNMDNTEDQHVKLCGAIDNANHDLVKAYEHVRECHPRYLDYAVKHMDRTISYDEYDRLRQIAPRHAERCKSRISLFGPIICRDRVKAGFRGINELIAIAAWERDAADVFALIVMHCDGFLSLQSQ